MEKGNLLQKTIAVILVLCMTMANFIFAVTSTVYAIANSSELEGGNVIFEAYFKNGDSKVMQKTANISEGEKLYLGLELKAGKLQEGKINIENANYEIINEEVNSKYVKSINGSEIALNEISYNDGKIEIELPVKFQETEKVAIAYFNMENSISLSGKYTNSEKEKNITSDMLKTRLIWTEGLENTDSNLGINYSANIEKIIYLEDKTLIQTVITSTFEEDYFPKFLETVQINVPKINGVVPSYTALVNGNKISPLAYIYNEETGTLKFQVSFDDGDNIIWKREGDTYKVIYVYEGVTSLEEPIQIKPEITTAIYAHTVTMTGKPTALSNTEKGSIVSVEAKATSNNVYKGYMYANYGETTYAEEYNMELSSKDIENATFELQEDNFKTENGGTVTTNVQTEYKEIKINKASLDKVLGTAGTLEIIPEHTTKITVNSQTEVDEAGNIVISYDQIKNSHNVKLQIKGAENEGTIKISATKAIKGNAGYDKDTLKTINAIETTVKAYSEKDKTPSIATATTELKDTATEATLSMNNDNTLSTTKENDVEFTATLKTGTMETDLLENPTIKIILPEEVANTEITSVSALYGGETLQISSQEVVDNNKAILVKLDGTQENYINKFIEGIKVVVNAKITLSDTAISRNANIEMKYANEKAQEHTTTIDVKVQAPDGLITKTVVNAEFETANKGVETLTTSIVNNYGTTIENLMLIGTIPNVELTQEEFETKIKETAKAIYTPKAGEKREHDGQSIKIEYSADGENWTNKKEGATYFRITAKEGNIALNVGDKLAGQLSMDIANIMSDFKLSYTINGEEQEQSLKIDKVINNLDNVKEPEEQEESSKDNNNEEPTNTNETEPLTVKIVAKVGNETLNDGDEVFEGQAIRYTYTITNNTDKEIKNVKLIANHENANVFEEVTEQQENTENSNEMRDFTTEKEQDGKSNKEENIGTLKAHEKTTISYQIRAKEDVEKIKNNVTISADDIEDVEITTENAVKEAELKLAITNNRAKEFPVSKGMVVPNILEITNISNKDKKDVIVTINVPKEFKLFWVSGEETNSNFEILSQEENILILKIKKITAGLSEKLKVSLQLKEENPDKEEIQISYIATLNNVTYTSNEAPIGMTNNITSKLSAEQTSNIKEEQVKTGDNLIYKITIKNESNNSDCIKVTDYVPAAAVIKNAYYVKNSEKVEIKDINKNSIIEMIDVEGGETIELFIETQIDEEKTGREEITNYATISGLLTENEITTNEITYKLQANIKKQDEKENEKENEEKDPNNQGGNTDVVVKVRHSISGLAWIDANKNGIREASEKLLPGIKVSLANVETGKYIADTTTNEKGEYKFEDIEDGKYIVILAYDNTKYRNTEYRASGASETKNSDIITSKLSTSNEDIKYAVTDTLELKAKSLENIDAGFIENEIFDLNLNKYITKVTVQNSSGTVLKQYSKEQLAKVEIDAKNLAGSTVLVEYTLQVENKGEIAGYANEVVDYLPKDLTFSSEMNKNWYLSTDGYLHTNALAKDLINPGETKTVTLTLVKKMTENNTGLTSNKAEIAKSSNDLSIPDKNLKSGSSTSTAELIISIRTGEGLTIGIIVAIIAITATGIVIYTKKRKEASHE